jgi:phosphoadenosine phosphosulfate reductase
MNGYRAVITDFGHLEGEALLKTMIRQVFPGRIALVSSFGAEAAILAHMIAKIDPETPVIMVDTGRLFPETLAYRDQLTAALGLKHVISVRPDEAAIGEHDPGETLNTSDPDACCHIRKIKPLEKALRGYQALITGRKQMHGETRAGIATLEEVDWRLKVNPLAGWTRQDVDRYFEQHALPRHPLVEKGFLSIGCSPCTTPVQPGEDIRAGRWRGSEKTECGIHWPRNGQPMQRPETAPRSTVRV